MDIQLPVLDGYEATRQIKADPKLAATPIIAVSSFAMKGDEEKARASGCDHYVTKPYSPMSCCASSIASSANRHDPTSGLWVRFRGTDPRRRVRLWSVATRARPPTEDAIGKET